MRLSILAAILMGMALPASFANADTITEQIDFSLGGLIDVAVDPPLASPASQISGSFVVTFDPLQVYIDDTSDLVINSFSGATVGSPIGFTYLSNLFFLGGTENGVTGISPGTNDLLVELDVTDPANPRLFTCAVFSCGSQTGNPAYDASGFTTSDTSSLWVSAAADSWVAVVVPEPASMALFPVGILGVMSARRSKK
jgi:hypothetical protein